MIKKLFLILTSISFATVALAADLTTPKNLTPLTADGIKSGFEVRGSADSKRVTYPYYWLDSSGDIIRPYDGRRDGKQVFTCKDWDSVPGVTNGDCIANDDPDPCCDDVDSGTCDDAFDNADCVGEKDPLNCCTDVAEGVCDCWNDIKSLFGPVKNYLDGELDKWEDISRQ